MKLLPVILLWVISWPSHALYKCQVDGRIEYRDLPCPVGKMSTLKVDPMRPRPEDARRYKLQVLKEQLDQVEGEIKKVQDASRMRALDDKCRRLGRDLDWTRSRAGKYANDQWWRNRAQDRQEEFDALCN